MRAKCGVTNHCYSNISVYHRSRVSFTETSVSASASRDCPVSFPPPCRAPWALLAGQVLWSQTPSAFVYPGTFQFVPSSWSTGLMDLGFMVDSILVLWIYCPPTPRVSDENPACNHAEDPLCGTSRFSLAAFKILSLSFESLIMMCLGVGRSEFIGILECLHSHLSSYLGRFSPYVLRYSASSPHLLRFPQYWSIWEWPTRALRLHSLFSIFIFSFPQTW